MQTDEQFDAEWGARIEAATLISDAAVEAEMLAYGEAYEARFPRESEQ